MTPTASIPRRIGVLSGGGDAPGINAVIRAVTLDAIHSGIEVVGILDGFLGLIENRTRPLAESDVRDILSVGGSILGCSNKANPSRYADPAEVRPAGQPPVFRDVTDRCLTTLDRLELDALVCIGGDGTMSSAQSIAFPQRFGHDHPGLNCIGVPKTIDNDLVGTDLTFGFLTAASIAAEAIDRLRTTAASHHRVMAVEVMGRNAGWIALHAGLAGGAHAILIPEIRFSFDVLCRAILRRREQGQRYSILCVAEGAVPKGGSALVARTDPTSPDPIKLGGIAQYIATQVEERLGIEARHTVLGHVQRGGSPVALDRVMATRFGHHATTILKAGARNRMVAWQGGRMTDVDIAVPAGKQRTIQPDEPLLEAARDLGITFADGDIDP